MDIVGNEQGRKWRDQLVSIVNPARPQNFEEAALTSHICGSSRVVDLADSGQKETPFG